MYNKKLTTEKRNSKTFKSLVLSVSLVLAGTICAPLSAQVPNVQWKQNFGGSDWDQYNSVTAVSDGIIAVGYSREQSFNTGDWAGVAGKGDRDAIIIKYDNTGNVLWKKNFGGGDLDYFMSVTAVSNGVVAVGYSGSGSFNNGDWTGNAGRGMTDAIIVKYDNNGNVVWKKYFGDSEHDYFYSTTAVSDGILAVGYSSVNGTGDWAGMNGNGGYDAFIVKYNNDGNVVWKKYFGGKSFDYFQSVTATSDGIEVVGFSAANTFNSGDWAGYTANGNDDAIIVKYDNAGNVLWKKNLGGSDEDRFLSVTAAQDGTVAVGYSGGPSFNTGDWADVTGKGGTDAIIIKYDNTGNVLWKKNFGGSGEDYFQSIMAVSDGVVVSGYSYVNNTGDWTSNAGNGGNDAIIVKYDNAGNIVWKKNFGGNSSEYFMSITAASGGIAAAGYSTQASFNTGDWTGITGKGGNDAAIVKYSFGTSAIDEVQADNLKIYPNPVKDVLYIDIPFFQKMEYLKNVEILDLSGRTVWALRATPIQEGNATINVASLPQGVYFLKIQTDKGIITKKFIKQ